MTSLQNTGRFLFLQHGDGQVNCVEHTGETVTPVIFIFHIPGDLLQRPYL